MTSEMSSSVVLISAPIVLPREVLLFIYDECLWGVDVGRVVKLVTENHLSPIPLVMERLAGVIKYEGQAVPVFVPPTAKLPDMATWEKDATHLVVLLEHEKGLIGCMIDGVEHAARPDEFMFEDVDEEVLAPGVDVPDNAHVNEIGITKGYFLANRALERASPDMPGRPFTFLSVSSILGD